MRKPAILAVDFGSQSAKALAFDNQGNLLATHGVNYPWIHPGENMVEIDPERVWNAAQEAVGKCVDDLADKYEFKSLGFSYFGHGVLTVDENYNPTSNIILLADKRAEGLANEIPGGAEAVMEATRISEFNPNGMPVKIYWLKKNRPDIYEKTAHVFDIQQFVLARLGLDPVNDGTMATCKFAYDVYTGKWSEKIMDTFSIPRSWLTKDVVASDYVVGKITKFGNVDLKSEVQVIPGTHDTESGILGMGAIPENPGVLSDSMGTYHQCGFLVDFPEGEFPETGWASFITKCGRYRYYTNTTSNGGSSMSWFIRTFCGGEPIYDELFEKSPFDGTNPTIFFPKFSRGQAAISNMSISRTREQLFEALIEGITFELTGGYDLLRARVAKYQGCDIKEIRAMGGGSQADKFLQLRATVFGIPVVRSSHVQGTGAGAAMMAAVGTGVYKDYKEATDNMVTLTDRFEPDEKLRPIYLEKYERYKEFIAKL